uniref:hypothetical protein n=1 Tax=Pararhizobium sp. IMCC3301 TaxID=3067904 RepID=UPI0027421E7A|nr:hypothetical protein [Pararhizobium sp. IMCC3301]
MYKYAFIGAGPAALSAVVELPLDDRAMSVIVDAGLGCGRKICPALKSQSCSSCFGEKCHVVNGIGGSSATFGNKFCHFPASSGVQELMQTKPIARSKAPRHDHGIVVLHPNVPNRKVYDVNIAHADNYKDTIDDLVADVQFTTPILEEWSVDSIERRGAAWFRLVSETGEVIDTENVVIATGRSGHISLRRWLDQLDISYSENSPDIGVRIEAPSDVISRQFLYQDDPKFKFDFGELGQARTFCTCKGGQIVPVKFGKGSFADGAFVRKDTGRTNVALMARTGETFEPQALAEWCESVNEASGGRLLLGAFDAFSGSKANLETAILDMIPDGPSPLYKKAIRALLHRLINDPSCQIFEDDTEQHLPLKVFGPSIDLYWPKVQLSPGFNSSVDGVYIIGDAAGVSRGIIQAMAAGKSWAQTVSSKVVQSIAQW